MSHGNNVVAYIVEAHDLGVEWTKKDIAAMCVLLKEIIWTTAGDKAQYAAYVDGTGSGNGWFNDGFMKLGRYDEEIQRRLETQDLGRTYRSVASTRNVQFIGNAALNAKRLAERKK